MCGDHQIHLVGITAFLPVQVTVGRLDGVDSQGAKLIAVCKAGIRNGDDVVKEHHGVEAAADESASFHIVHGTGQNQGLCIAVCECTGGDCGHVQSVDLTGDHDGVSVTTIPGDGHSAIDGVSKIGHRIPLRPLGVQVNAAGGHADPAAQTHSCAGTIGFCVPAYQRVTGTGVEICAGIGIRPGMGAEAVGNGGLILHGMEGNTAVGVVGDLGIVVGQRKLDPGGTLHVQQCQSDGTALHIRQGLSRIIRSGQRNAIVKVQGKYGILTGVNALSIVFNGTSLNFLDEHQNGIIGRSLCTTAQQQEQGKNQTNSFHHDPSLRTGNRRSPQHLPLPAGQASTDR